MADFLTRSFVLNRNWVVGTGVETKFGALRDS
jgi:hypothetical protein